MLNSRLSFDKRQKLGDDDELEENVRTISALLDATASDAPEFGVASISVKIAAAIAQAHRAQQALPPSYDDDDEDADLTTPLASALDMNTSGIRGDHDKDQDGIDPGPSQRTSGNSKRKR